MLRPTLVALPLALLPAGAQTLSFAPAADLTLTKTFELGVEMELDDLSLLANGSDVTEMIGDVDISFSIQSGVTVTDTFAEMAEGRPNKLVREYDAITGDFTAAFDSEFESDEMSEPVESDLEGETVVFLWSDENGAFDVEFESGEGDEALLVGLTEDMDLRTLLPQREVSVGDEWKLDPGTLYPLLAPGGSLGIGGSDDEAELAELLELISGGDFDELIDSIFDGEMVATFAGTEEDDHERKLAVIEVRIEIDSTTDLSEAILTLIDELGEGEVDIEISTADIGLEIEGTARLEWDLDAGHFHHFEAQAEMSVVFDFVADGEGDSVDASVELSGDMTMSADVER